MHCTKVATFLSLLVAVTLAGDQGGYGGGGGGYGGGEGGGYGGGEGGGYGGGIGGGGGYGGGIGGGYGKHEVYPPQPYGFGYDIKDHYGNQQFRKESSDGKRVVGSYGFTDAHGIHRLVDYVADEHGFRAKVRTNEPGTANQDPAHVHVQSAAGHHGGGGGGGGGYH